MTDFEHIADLVFRSLSGPLPDAEQQELAAWTAASPRNREWYEQIQEEEYLRRLFLDFRGDQAEASKTRVFARIEADILSDSHPVNDLSRRPVHRVHFLKTAWLRYAAAIIILFGIGVYFWNTQNNSRTITQTQPVPVKNDVLPGSDKAILTLGDGQQVSLDSTANTLLAEKGIINNDALLVYKSGDANSVMNTLATPKGGQYKIKLSDGTMVWLNAASSITYPTVFVGKMRAVKVTGEVYFEVTQNKSTPFIVETEKEKITVLGTSFNVNRYTDEPAGKISLIEGAVKVNEVVLKPGQAYQEGKLVQTKIEQDVAWKNGVFDFNGANIQSVMRQIARWYDVEVVFEGKNIPARTFGGELSRKLNLSEILDVLKVMQINFRLDGKKLYVN